MINKLSLYLGLYNFKFSQKLFLHFYIISYFCNQLFLFPQKFTSSGNVVNENILEIIFSLVSFYCGKLNDFQSFTKSTSEWGWKEKREKKIEIHGWTMKSDIRIFDDNVFLVCIRDGEVYIAAWSIFWLQKERNLP